MAVETYLIEEVSEMIDDPEKVDEWHKQVEALGLEGQKNLAKPEKSPIPFPKLKTNEARVYNTLCPDHTSIENYSEGTIPLRVLSMAALCKQENYFERLEVYYDKGGPDPCLIGKTGKYGTDEYLIARWGDELCSFAELEVRAIKKWIETRKLKLESALTSLEADARKYLKLGEWVSSI